MGLFDKIKKGLQKTSSAVAEQINDVMSNFRKVDEDMLEELFDAMVLADLGPQTAQRTIDELRERAKKKKIDTPQALRAELKDILVTMMQPPAGLSMGGALTVILIIGVNGVGKTTTIGKLASRFTSEGKKVLLAAADTFRAAAAEQLTIWAQRAGADIVRHQEGADPAAVVFDSITAAKARGCDVVLVDTAGRLHNKQNLMNELNKISRVIEREAPASPRHTLLVLDATTGQNAVVQAEEFNKVAHVDGIVLTKLDGTAKGGIVVAISANLGVPVEFIGVGEGVDDLMPFDRSDFIEALLPPQEE